MNLCPYLHLYLYMHRCIYLYRFSSLALRFYVYLYLHNLIRMRAWAKESEKAIGWQLGPISEVPGFALRLLKCRPCWSNLTSTTYCALCSAQYKVFPYMVYSI